MNILLACEESQAVCIEMRKRGHNAFSCDLLPCSGGHPEWHIQGDVLEQLDKGWDMLIGFPPCTHLAVSGNRSAPEKIKDGRRQQAIDFFMNLIDAPVPKIIIENPVGIMSSKYRKPDQIVHPYYFGDQARKSTCFWLKKVSLLKHYPKDDLFAKKTHVEPLDLVYASKRTKSGFSRYSERWKLGSGKGHERSKTYPGIARAMAEQWG